jgi:hypothetical protein
MEGGPVFSFSAPMLSSLEGSISRDRLAPYLRARTNNLSSAIKLHEANVHLSVILFGVIHGLEISLRNAVHRELTIHLGDERWFEDPVSSPDDYLF